MSSKEKMKKTRKSKYTKEILEPIVKAAKSISSIIKAFGLKQTGGNYSHFQKMIKFHNIDITHFTGQAWNRGETAKTNEIVRRLKIRNSFTEDEILSENASASVRRRNLLPLLLVRGFLYQCSIENCTVTDNWLNKPITLHIDHINGINNDNRLINLRFLCPNCHQQTITWGHKKGRFGTVAGN